MLTAVMYSVGLAITFYQQTHSSFILTLFSAGLISVAILLYSYTPVIKAALDD